MKKVILAAVVAIALAPIATITSPVAYSAPCSQSGPTSQACQNCVLAQEPNPALCFGDAVGQQAPANPPNDSCAPLLIPPNASIGAYNGCETARQAAGQ